MGRVREIPRTAAFAWSADIANPSIATGTRAGAVDADFSGETKLEIWDLDLANHQQDVEIQPNGSLNTESRFYDLAWSPPTSDHSAGIIAGALETGSLSLWDAAKLKTDSLNALISSTTKHTGAIKAVQFNPHRPELLATSGAKGEVFITNLNDVENASRLGVATARADDIDALDWNKKVPHIMATAGSGGFVTVWDVKERKERLTLNNYGRKAVSAVAWDPDSPTKLATAVASDQDPLILVWDLRNSSAPERILKGHEQGVLSLSWCVHDTDLLISCGKDNRNICWNPHAGEIIGEFPIVTNWTFQTRFNPRHPTLLATASFDGKINVQTTQNTNAPASKSGGASGQAADGADFFASAQIQPQTSSFSLPQPPKWFKRPIGASFGFGGKLVKFSTMDEQPQKSTISISTFASDTDVDTSISSFQSALKTDNLTKLCESKISAAQVGTNQNDWKIMQTLFSETPRKGLLNYLGFADIKVHPEDGAHDGEDGSNHVAPQPNDKINGVKDNSHKRLSSFFDGTGTSNQDFLADLAASKGGRTNNPFEIYTGSESEADTEITRAIILGSFEEAMDICLKKKRMSEAFMIAICGGQKCIDKAQAAYFAQSSDGPNYLRLLASVVDKNLWDVVYNANLDNWADVMATLCTYADENEFPDLCEALGDRLEEFSPDRKDATFCYLAGSKLEKLIPIWIREMQDLEKRSSESASDESAFSIHVQALQNLVEKVTIFRKVTRYEDKDGKDTNSGWRLESLYNVYTEYADVVASYGYLDLADQYLSLLPAQYPAAEVARNRVRQATKKAVAPTSTRPQVTAASARPATAISAYGPSPSIGAPAAAASLNQNAYNAVPSRLAQPSYQPNFQPSSSPYAPATPFGAQQYQPIPTAPVSLEQSQPGPTPPRSVMNGTNWNDLPETLAQRPPTSRRGTPGPAANIIRSPFINAPETVTAPPPPPTGRIQTPLPPPPKVGSPRPPTIAQGFPQAPPTTSAAASAYGPPQTAQTLPPPQQSMPRGPSPYNPPPPGAANPSRYAPSPGTPATPGLNAGPPAARVIAPNPYAQPPPSQPSSTARPSQPPNFAPPPPPRAQSAATGPPPRAAFTQPPPPPPMSVGPPQMGGPPAAAAAQTSVVSATSLFPAGDRSHIQPDALPIYQVLDAEFQRIKGLAPASFKQHVDDTEKRLNLLYDSLNNGQLVPEVVAQLKDFSSAFGARNFDLAIEIHTQLLKLVEQSPPWMVGLKRFISMSKVTPIS